MGNFFKPRYYRWVRLAAGLLVSVTMIANMAQAQDSLSVPVQFAPNAQWKTLDDLKKAFPNAMFRQVRPEDLKRVKRQYQLEGRTVLPLPLVQTEPKKKCMEETTGQEVACPPKEVKKEKCWDPSTDMEEPCPDESGKSNLESSSSGGGGMGGSDGGG